MVMVCAEAESLLGGSPGKILESGGSGNAISQSTIDVNNHNLILCLSFEKKRYHAVDFHNYASTHLSTK